ncbi:MAG: hypothetical protein LUG89_02110 [Methanosphaera sp.]|nr:hypothetical protein [Methanosphaera sp.]
MTLLISITTDQGIVLASDSRQSQTNTNHIVRILTDNAVKIFELNSKVAIGAAGLSTYINDQGRLHTVSKYIQQYKETNNVESMSVEALARDIHRYIYNKFPWKLQIDETINKFKNDVASKKGRVLSINVQDNIINYTVQYPNKPVEQGNITVEPIDLLICGYNPGGDRYTYEAKIPGSVDLKRDSNDYGATWVGQTDVLTRLILGYDPNILNTDIFRNITQNNPDKIREVQQQLTGVEYNIPWSLLTLQDAIDLSVFLIKITSQIKKFSNGINMDMGDLQGVGGSVDVLVIKPDEIQWINKKQLHYPKEE